MTALHKFAWPVLWSVFIGWIFLSPILNGPRRLHMLGLIALPIIIPETIYFLWYALAIKRVDMAENGLTVSDCSRSETIPWSAVVTAVQRRWPDSHPVRLTLNTTCLGKRTVHFMPSNWAKLEADGRRRFWQRFKWHAHPIVDEINNIVKDTGEQGGGDVEPAAGSTPVTADVGT